MLLALDIGNTNVTLGVFEGDDLRATWRIATDASRMPDEYGLAISQLLAMREVSRGQIDSVVLCSVVPPLTPSFVILARDYFGVSPLVVGTGHQDRNAHPVRKPARRRRRPDRRRRGRLEALRRARHRGRHRDGDRVRRRDGAGRVYRRGHLPRSQDRSRLPLPQHIHAPERRAEGAAGGHRQEHRSRHAVRPRPRLHRPGHRDGRPVPAGARRAAPG